MSQVTSGVCRHCGCTAASPCRLEDGDGCCWITQSRTVCSNPRCVRTEAQRVQRAKDEAAAARPKRLNSAEVHAQICRRRRRGKGKAA